MFAEASTQYVISVRAFNDADKGPVVYDLVYTAMTSYSTCARGFIGLILLIEKNRTTIYSIRSC